VNPLASATPEVRLNLMLAHPRLPAERVAEARRIAAGITEPDRLVAMAARKLSLPVVSRYFAEIGFTERFPEAAAQSRRLVLYLVAQRLRQLAALKRFEAECVAPAGVRAIYFKGPTLDAHYGETARVFRDIDVLLDEESAARLVARATAQGYRVVLDANRGVMAASERDIRAARRYLKEITLFSPEGVSFEIHHRVDRHLSLFDTKSIMARAAEVEIGGLRLPTFPADTHFVYLCYHACRHMWSHMHWVADLNAIASHPSFDRDRCLAEADAHGLRRCVEASLGMVALCADPLAWGNVDPRSREGVLLAACIENLAGDRATELRLRKQGVGPGPDWRVPEGREREFRLREILFQMSPKITQYEELPLPDALQWLYYFTRPVYGLRHLASRRSNP
jgi:hypothetical protein